ADKITGQVVALRQRMQGLARNVFQGDLTLEFDAVGAVLGHGFHPWKPGKFRSIPNLQSVHRLGCTPNSATSRPGRDKMRATKLVSVSVALCAVVVGADNASAGGVNVPTVNVPRVNVPKPTVVPKVNVPRVNVNAPGVTVPRVNVNTPGVTVPRVTVPRVNVNTPGVTGPRVNVAP